MADGLEVLIGTLVMASLPGYLVLQALLLARYRGGWQLAALIPLIAFLPLLLHALVALVEGSNLWPLMLILVAPVAFAYLCGVALLHFKRTGTAFF